MHKILKAFPYSPDGVRVVLLVQGDKHEIRSDLVSGLKAAELIGPIDAMPGAPEGDAPAAGAPADASPRRRGRCTREPTCPS